MVKGCTPLQKEKEVHRKSVQKEEFIENQRWRDCENFDRLDMVGVGASMNLHRGALYICTNLKKFFANSLERKSSCRQSILLLSVHSTNEFGSRPKISLVHLLSNIQLYGRSWSHGSQGSPIPETKRCLRLLNSIG